MDYAPSEHTDETVKRNPPWADKALLLSMYVASLFVGLSLSLSPEQIPKFQKEEDGPCVFVSWVFLVGNVCQKIGCRGVAVYFVPALSFQGKNGYASQTHVPTNF